MCDEENRLVQEGLLRDPITKWDRYEDIVTCGIVRI